MFIKISLNSKEPLTLTEKKSYLESFYPERITYTADKNNNLGFFHKFNNAIGFKEVVSYVDNTGIVQQAAIKSPDDYIYPSELLSENYFVAIESPTTICDFYLPNISVIHPLNRFTYQTKDIADKFTGFLEKIFPGLEITKEEVYEKPNQSLYEFSLDFFTKSLEKELNCTVEFSSKEKLTKEEVEKILSIVQELSNDTLAIAQFKCETCSDYSNGEKHIHIEIVYMTWYGKDVTEARTKEYGDCLWTV